MGKSKVNSEVVKAAVKAANSSSDSSSSSSDSDKKKKVAAKPAATPAKRKSSSSSSSSSSSDSDSDKKKKVAPAAKKSPAAKPAATPAKKAKSSSSSSDSSSDSDSDKKKPAAAKAKSPAAKPVATPAKKAASSSSSSSSSDSDSDKKKPAAKAKSPAAKPAATPAKKAASSSSSSSSDSDEEMKQAPAAPAAAKRKRESSSSSSSSSDSDDEKKPAAKADAPKDDFTALKKQKTENGSVAVVTANGGASNTIFVGGLSFDASEDDVKDFFKEFGTIKTVRIPVHSDTGRKKGLAFVEFESPASAAAACAKDQAEMMGRWLNVSLSTSGTRPSAAPRAQELSEKPAGCKTVFVGNLSWQASEDDLRAAFAECGSINNVRIAWDQENDRSKGFGHVEFDDESAVDLAVKCAGTEVAGRAIRVDYAPVREGRKSFGGGGGGFGGDRGGRGGRGGARGGAGGRGGRGGRGGASTPMNMNKNKATMGGFSGKKVSFD